MSNFNGNRGQGRRGGQIRRGGPPPMRAQLGALKSSLHGHANRLGGTNPPPFNRRPYGTITVEEVVTTATDLQRDIGQVMTALAGQLGITSDHLVLKVQRVDIWVMPTGAATSTGVTNAIPTVRARFFSLVLNVATGATVATSNALKELEDIGCPGAHAAVVSYTWPRDQQDMPMIGAQGTGNIPVVDFTIAANCTAYLRYHLHWSLLDDEATKKIPLK